MTRARLEQSILVPHCIAPGMSSLVLWALAPSQAPVVHIDGAVFAAAFFFFLFLIILFCSPGG